MPLRAHLEVAAPLVEERREEKAGALWNNLGYHYHAWRNARRRGRPTSGRWRLTRARWGLTIPNVAILVNNLGMVLQDLGDLAAARAAYERALAHRRGVSARITPMWPRCQQPGECAARPGRPAGGAGGLRAGAGHRRGASSARSTRRWPSMSTTWGVCCKTWATWRGRGRPSSGR